MHLLGYSMYKIMSSASRDFFTSVFKYECLLFPFSPLIALARTSSTMSNRSGKSRHLILVEKHPVFDP